MYSNEIPPRRKFNCQVQQFIHVCRHADANELTLLLLLCYFVRSEWKKTSSLRIVCGCGGNSSCIPEFGACPCSLFFKDCHMIIVATSIIAVLP